MPRWLLAALLASLWHALVGGGLMVLDPFAADAVEVRPEPIQFVFAAPPLSPPVDQSDEPTRFTELPPDRADLAPETPDALSNVDSRARDQATDGPETAQPRMSGEADLPAVGLLPSPATPPVPDGHGREDSESELDDGGPDPLTERSNLDASQQQDRADSRLAAPHGAPGQGLQPGARTGSTEPRFLVGAGRDDVVQEEMNNPAGNVSLFGDLSLNTVAWNWAPWIQRFTRDFHRNWVPPYAYLIGLIEGNQLVEIEVSKAGELLSLVVLEEVGHESLRASTVGNFRGLFYQPLPDDFPEPTLKLTVRVIYRGRPGRRGN